MKKLLLIVLFTIGLISCSPTKRGTVSMPKWGKEHKGTKRQIRKFTKEFVKNLYDTTKSIDTVEIENIIQK